MTEYRRFYYPGATWFFTVNLAERRGTHLLTELINLLRAAFTHVKKKHPYKINAIIVLPEYLHWILTLLEVDTDFSTRWGIIKANFSRRIANGERISQSRESRGERGLWPRRFWEHLIRDESDLRQHVDYIHWNPVKHGWARHVKDWPYSSFHRYVSQGIYPDNWGTGFDIPLIDAGE